MLKLKVGIIGAGRIAAIMAHTLNKMHGVQAYAIASRSLEKAQAFAFENGIEHAYGSYEEMVDDKKIDLVYIATPHNFHFEQAKLCIDHKKAVLVEKPFCVNAEQTKELLEYAAINKIFITEAMWIRYLPMYETIQEILKSEIIGTPKILTANLGYEMTDKERLLKPELAGGALLDVGIYPINFASMFFGDEIKEISAKAVKTEEGVDAQDSITFTYQDGRMSILNSTMLAVSDRMGVIQGSKGFMVIENINNFQSVTVYDSEYNKLLYKKCPRQISGYEYEIMACKEAIKKKELSCQQMTHETTLNMMRVLDEIRQKINLVYPFETNKK